jgi:hypothetical protein
VGTTTITITGTDAKGFETTTDWYKDFVLTNSTQSLETRVLSNTYASASGGTIVLTVADSVSTWLVTDTCVINGLPPFYEYSLRETLDLNDNPFVNRAFVLSGDKFFAYKDGVQVTD